MSDDKIDVMAVIDRLMRAPCDACSGDCGSANPPVIGCPQREAIEARAAIAELIKAAREVRGWVPHGPWFTDAPRAASARFDAALARFGAPK